MIINYKHYLGPMLIQLTICLRCQHGHTKFMLEILATMVPKESWKWSLRNLEDFMMCGWPVIPLALPLSNLKICMMQKMLLSR